MDAVVIGVVVTDITAKPIAAQDTWKDKQRIGGISLSTGGDAANQAIRMADLGMSVAITGCVGKDQAGMLAKAALKERGVDITRMKESPDRETGSSLILVREDGERNIFSNNGAHGQIYKEDCAWILDKVKENVSVPKPGGETENEGVLEPGAEAENREIPEPGGEAAAAGRPGIRALSVASLFCVPYLEEDGLEELLRECRKRGVLTFADLGSDKKHQGFEGIRRFLPHLDYFLPSEEDSLRMTGKDTPEEAAAFFLEHGCGCAVVKCAARGAYYCTERESGWVPALPVTPVDTTGAGDCMSAHFIHGILAGLPLREACRSACEAASRSTLKMGASTAL